MIYSVILQSSAFGDPNHQAVVAPVYLLSWILLPPPDMKGSSGHSIFPPPPVLRRSSDVLDKSTVHVLDERKAPRHTLGGGVSLGRTGRVKAAASALCVFFLLFFSSHAKDAITSIFPPFLFL